MNAVGVLIDGLFGWMVIEHSKSVTVQKLNLLLSHIKQANLFNSWHLRN